MHSSDLHQLQTRRAFLGRSGAGLGALALALLVKRVTWLYMAGGASHLETFDYKPRLAAMNGQPMPESYTVGQPIAQLQGQRLVCLGPQHAFRKCGQSG